MIIDKRLIGLCKVAAKDEMRPMLATVKVTEKKAVATDGYRLMTIETIDLPKEEKPTLGDLEHDEPSECILQAQKLEKLLKSIPKSTMPILEQAYTVKAGEGKSKVAYLDSDMDIVSQEFTRPSGEYPAYEKLLDQTKQYTDKRIARVNAKFLIETLQAIIAVGIENESYVDIEIADATRPIELTAKDVYGKEVYAMIMPLRRT